MDSEMANLKARLDLQGVNDRLARAKRLRDEYEAEIVLLEQKRSELVAAMNGEV